MTKIAALFILAVCVVVTGCTTTTTTTIGRDFDATKISEITKGKTSANELSAMLGLPFRKTVKSESDIEWVYSWVQFTRRVEPGWSAGNTHVVGNKKELIVLLRNDIIVNFAYDAAPFEQEAKEEFVRQKAQ